MIKQEVASTADHKRLVSRIKQVIAEKGWTARGWSIASGLSADAIRNIFDAKSRSPRIETLEALAKTAGRTLAWLRGTSDETGSPESDGPFPRPSGRELVLIGYIGAGDQVFHFGISEARETVEAPPGVTRGIAAEVRGVSMLPVYRDGDLVIGAEHTGNVEELVGSDCFVQVQDGPLYLKILRKGSRGRFHLESYNSEAAPIQNQIVEWAAPVAWVRRRQR